MIMTYELERIGVFLPHMITCVVVIDTTFLPQLITYKLELVFGLKNIILLLRPCIFRRRR
jgi:hypothetical protein